MVRTKGVSTYLAASGKMRKVREEEAAIGGVKGWWEKGGVMSEHIMSMLHPVLGQPVLWHHSGGGCCTAGMTCSAWHALVGSKSTTHLGRVPQFNS
jgi:hypothetical protein